ncbi:MAG: potassium/proton antiporter [Massiliimalia sp.]|jgi:cell volume regulation protein A
MDYLILISAVVLFACVLANQFSHRFGMPALLLFMSLGMIFGSDGIFKIHFSNYYLTQDVCSVALVFIMFYGGFGTNWSVAKPVAAKSLVLSSAGVVGTAGLVGIFCFSVLKLDMLESLLIGSVISSTDAASVFSILKSKKLGLKEGSASLLELESGSNDPASYMLTMIVLTLMKGQSVASVWGMLFKQLFFGIGIGVLLAFIGIFLLHHMKLSAAGLDTTLVVAVALASYGFTNFLGGNGFLSVYLTGIIMGNSKIRDKSSISHFFDSLTGLSQICIFFLLGLLSFPHRLGSVLLTALPITLFLTLVARPAMVFLILKLFRSSTKQCLLVSWAGLRGAASIVFAIMVIANEVSLSFDLYHLVFVICLFSVALQGSLLPFVSRKLDMVDRTSDVRKTFNDYQQEDAMTLMRMFIPKGHHWENKTFREISLPYDSLALMVKRQGETLVPKGDTLIQAEDTIILNVPTYRSVGEEDLKEMVITSSHPWCNKTIEELDLPKDILIAGIRRNGESVIPRGKTKILEQDTVVLYR